MVTWLLLLLIAAAGFFVLWGEGLLETRWALFLSAALLLLAMLPRALCMDHETLDYQTFLTKWVQFYRDNGGFRALGKPVGNYNVPYLVFLAAFSYLPLRDLYLIKLLSILFDLVLAWGTLRLASLFQTRPGVRLAAFFLPLFLPTVVLNGAYWGQCDVIYASLALWSVCFALEDKPVRSVVFIALSFAFKLQAVFVMPVFLVFLFTKRLRAPHLLLFPLTYLAAVLPAVLAGRPLADTLTLYFSEAGTVGGGLNYNSASVYALLRGGTVNAALLAKLGIAAAALFLLLLFAFCWAERGSLDRKRLLLCAVLISVVVPFFLPHMHDRYFFPADVLSLALVFAVPQLFPVPVLVSFASLMGYHAYLTKRWFLDQPQSLAWGACALLAVIIVLILTLALSGRSQGEHEKR